MRKLCCAMFASDASTLDFSRRGAGYAMNVFSLVEEPSWPVDTAFIMAALISFASACIIFYCVIAPALFAVVAYLAIMTCTSSRL